MEASQPPRLAYRSGAMLLLLFSILWGIRFVEKPCSAIEQTGNFI